MMRGRSIAVSSALAALVWTATRGRPAPLQVEHNLDGGTLVRLPEGRLYHRVVGAGADLIMLPWFAGNSQTWRFITPPLAGRLRVHWLDLLGHGLSDKPADADYGAHAQAGRVAAWMDVVGLRRAVVLASSAGAQPAVALAARAPERVVALVLIDPFLTSAVPLRTVLTLAEALPRGSSALLRLLFRQRWFAWLSNMLGRRRPLSVDAETVELQYRTHGTPGFFEALPALLAGVHPDRAATAIPHVRCPTLLVWGSADRTARPSQFRALAARFPSAEATLLSDVGHVPQEEAPEALLHVVQPFLARVTA